jgi:hypothetical protein
MWSGLRAIQDEINLGRDRILECSVRPAVHGRGHAPVPPSAAVPPVAATAPAPSRPPPLPGGPPLPSRAPARARATVRPLSVAVAVLRVCDCCQRAHKPDHDYHEYRIGRHKPDHDYHEYRIGRHKPDHDYHECRIGRGGRGACLPSHPGGRRGARAARTWRAASSLLRSASLAAARS